jgi:acyl-CoA dehydrogenase
MSSYSIGDHGDFTDIREAVRDLCSSFPAEYHRKVDEERGYPEEFVDALTKAGWMAALIPEEYGGSGLGLTEASIIMEEINRAGGNSAACHAQMYTLGPILRHGSDEQKAAYLPRLASGELRLQSFAVTEPDAGSDTTRISTFAARRPGGGYLVKTSRRRPTGSASSLSTCGRPAARLPPPRSRRWSTTRPTSSSSPASSSRNPA